MENNYSNELNEEFLKLYRVMEKYKEDNDARYNYYANKYSSDFTMFKSIRNNLTHNISNNDYPVLVSSSVVYSLKKILTLMNKKAYEIGSKKIAYAYLNTPISKVISTIGNLNYSYIPIYQEYKVVIGVISEMTLIDVIDYLNKTKKINQIDKYVVADFMDFFKLDANPNGEFVFGKKNMPLHEAKELFARKTKNKKRVRVLFLTQNGLKSEKILAMITSWDIISDE